MAKKTEGSSNKLEIHDRHSIKMQQDQKQKQKLNGKVVQKEKERLCKADATRKQNKAESSEIAKDRDTQNVKTQEPKKSQQLQSLKLRRPPKNAIYELEEK